MSGQAIPFFRTWRYTITCHNNVVAYWSSLKHVIVTLCFGKRVPWVDSCGRLEFEFGEFEKESKLNLKTTINWAKMDSEWVSNESKISWKYKKLVTSDHSIISYVTTKRTLFPFHDDIMTNHRGLLQIVPFLTLAEWSIRHLELKSVSSTMLRTVLEIIFLKHLMLITFKRNWAKRCFLLANYLRWNYHFRY